MDAVAWLADNARFRTPEASFACREGCGFCCTYPPKVADERMAAIEAEVGSTPSFRDAHDNRRLALQGGCGGCVLLQERVCRAHEHRPDHCRLFPFHVYLGRRVEVMADRVCPGIAPEDGPAGPHEPATAFPSWEEPSEIDEAAREALALADVDELRSRFRRTRRAHEAVAEQARWTGDWRDPDEAVGELLAEARVTERAWREAVDAFDAEHVGGLPTTVIPGPDGFAWRTWRIAEGTLERIAFDEEGRTRLVGSGPAPDRPDALGDACRSVLASLADLEAFVGASMHLVEEGLSVQEAVRHRLEDVAAGLALHARLLEAEQLSVTTAWLRSVYEPEFYAIETLGEWY